MKYIQLAAQKSRFNDTQVEIRIMGDTYGVKDILKAMGAEWDSIDREWIITVDKDIREIGRINKMFRDADFGDGMTVRLISKSQALAAVQ